MNDLSNQEVNNVTAEVECDESDKSAGASDDVRLLSTDHVDKNRKNDYPRNAAVSLQCR